MTELFSGLPSLHYKPLPAVMTIIPLEISCAKQICGWTYEPPYRLYEWPSWDQMKQDGIEFGDPVLRQQQYKAIVNDRQELIGFAQLFPMSGVTRLGLGLRPDLCSRGLGAAAAALVTQEALRLRPDCTVDLEVLTWNLRAIRTYEKAGFRIDDTYIRSTPRGAASFHCMVFQPRS
ncbi:GNAT family N-acetyltransferase [Paenibacillus radicis (ex Gao et al. 2016)]|uniref:N-acetyltransferase n=1 Tax=Paenibacillus radicis (ex Gao et al. 2016) TaxID=1737354 RepID=A0A917M921_9BACL|nr:GNAT family N-acetyltransferase [Paenibacillus radicis (ex Gao et al. 2016)]GGG86986.1 N-acetyltransferase [Paenibacillus radicis (ex Gao et al. 2016)]